MCLRPMTRRRSLTGRPLTTAIGNRRPNLSSASVITSLSRTFSGRVPIGTIVPSKSRNSTKRDKPIDASRARTEAEPADDMSSPGRSHEYLIETPIRPRMDVMRGEIGPHPEHSSSAFILWHLQSILNRLCHPLGFVRVDHDRTGQFFGCSSHLTHQ